MRRRLTIAILCLVAATLVVSTIGSYFFIRRAAIATTQQDLAETGPGHLQHLLRPTPRTRAIFEKELRVISTSGAFSGIAFLALHPDGTVVGNLPGGVTAGHHRRPRSSRPESR